MPPRILDSLAVKDTAQEGSTSSEGVEVAQTESHLRAVRAKFKTKLLFLFSHCIGSSLLPTTMVLGHK